MRWFAERGHRVTGLDRSADATHAAGQFGDAILADIENEPWPLMSGTQVRQFDAVVVTNYLWRPLFPTMIEAVAPGGLLIYETFAGGNETVGKPSRADFLLQPGELLTAFKCLHPIAFEQGFLENPARFVQRLVSVRAELQGGTASGPSRYAL